MKPQSNEAVQVVAAILYRDGEVLIFRRGRGMSGAGQWEFPGGKVEENEDPVSALKREILEEIGIKIEVEDCLGENTHQYPTKKICLSFYWAPLPEEKFHLREHDAFRFVRPKDLDINILSEADRPIVDLIRENFRMKV